MKKLSLKIFVLTFLLMTVSACSKTELIPEDVIGKWNVIEFKVNMPELSPGLISSAREIALSTVYQFEKDSVYSSKSSFEKTEGTWWIKDNRIIMNYSSQYEKKGKEEYKIIEFKKSKMNWLSSSELGKTETILSKI